MTKGHEPRHSGRTAGNGRGRHQGDDARAADTGVDVEFQIRAGAVIAACSEWMASHVEGVVDAVIERMTGSIVAYERSARHADGLERLRANVEGIVRLFLRLLGDRRRLSADERTQVEEVGAMRAAEGFSLPLIQEGVHLAVDEGRAFVQQALVLFGDDKAALGAGHDIARLVQDFEFDLQRAIAAGFLRVRDERVASNARARDVLVRRLLEGALNTEELVGTPFEPLAGEPRLEVVVVQPLPSGSPAEEIAAAVAEAVAGPVEGPVAFSIPFPHAAVIVRHDAKRGIRALEAVGRARGGSLLVESASGVDDVARAYALLRDIIPLLPRPDSPGCTMAEAFLPVRLLLAAPRDQLIDYVERVLGNVFAGTTEQCAEDFLTSLLAFYDAPGAQVQQAAHALARPLNTVRKQLHRVEVLTGLDKVADRFRLEAAVRLWHHLRRQLACPGDPRWLRGTA